VPPDATTPGVSAAPAASAAPLPAGASNAPGASAAPRAPTAPPAGGLLVIPVAGIGEITRSTDLAATITQATVLTDGDVVVVTQKIVSKAEGRMVQIDPDDRQAKRALVEAESVRILRRRGDLVISETPQGFICANAGVDLSNVPQGTAALLPVDADRSARRIRERILALAGVRVAVIISDTFGRPWRRGVVDVAIGCAGVAAVLDLRGTVDATGRELVATEMCVADEIASAAELVMGKDRGVPVAVVRGIDAAWLRRSSVAEEILRPTSEDLFR
jgi:coenzyme F420-0:L-glutamate ligase / coenzyme F420-1:gamma-L-glutamate ligase